MMWLGSMSRGRIHASPRLWHIALPLLMAALPCTSVQPADSTKAHPSSLPQAGWPAQATAAAAVAAAVATCHCPALRPRGWQSQWHEDWPWSQTTCFFVHWVHTPVSIVSSALSSCAPLCWMLPFPCLYHTFIYESGTAVCCVTQYMILSKQFFHANIYCNEWLI